MPEKKKVLITGGCGFLGRHFAKYLHDSKWKIYIVDDLSSGISPDKWPEHLKIGDITFAHEDLRDYLKQHTTRYDLVIHLAAVVGGRAMIEGKPAMGTHSIELDALFFRWAAEYHPEQIIYMSSPVVYPINYQGMEDKQALKEDLVDFTKPYPVFGMPDLVYGWGKLTGEFLASTFAQYYDLNVFCPRPFSGYGEDQDESYPVPAICARALNREDPLTIWGSGKQSRDFIYVDDVVAAAISYLPKLTGYKAMNLGSGSSRTFREVAEIAARHVGYNPEVKNIEGKPEGVKTRFADIEEMLHHYQPKVSLEDGLKKVIEFLEKKK